MALMDLESRTLQLVGRTLLGGLFVLSEALVQLEWAARGRFAAPTPLRGRRVRIPAASPRA